MSKGLNAVMLEAFRDEVEKVAFLPSVRLRNAASLAGLGTVAGAGLGAVGKGVVDYRAARAQGAGTGEAIHAGLQGAGRGAVMGGAVGLGAGALGGAAVGRDLSGVMAHNTLGAPARAAQRQVHGILGHLSPEEYRAARGGDWASKQRLDAASTKAQGLTDLLRPNTPLSALQEGRDAQKELQSAGSHYLANRDAHEMGLTSLPGYVNAVREHGVGNVARTAVNHQFGGTSTLVKGIGIGLPALGLAATARGPDDGHKGERLGGEIGGTAGALLGSPLPIAGSMAASAGLGAAGRFAGRGVDRLRGSRPQPATDAIESSGQATPSERVITDRAQGYAPEGMG